MAMNKDKNDKRIRALKDVIKTGDTYALIGAGCSIQCGYPSWLILLEKIKDITISNHPSKEKEINKYIENDDPLLIADKLIELIKPKDFEEFINSTDLESGKNLTND